MASGSSESSMMIEMSFSWSFTEFLTSLMTLSPVLIFHLTAKPAVGSSGKIPLTDKEITHITIKAYVHHFQL